MTVCDLLMQGIEFVQETLGPRSDVCSGRIAEKMAQTVVQVSMVRGACRCLMPEVDSMALLQVPYQPCRNLPHPAARVAVLHQGEPELLIVEVAYAVCRQRVAAAHQYRGLGIHCLGKNRERRGTAVLIWLEVNQLGWPCGHPVAAVSWIW